MGIINGSERAKRVLFILLWFRLKAEFFVPILLKGNQKCQPIAST